VGDHDGVDPLADLRSRRTCVPAQMCDSRTQKRIGEQPHSTEFEDDSGVTHVGERARGRYRADRRGLRPVPHHPPGVIAAHPSALENRAVSDHAVDRSARARPIAVIALGGLGVLFALLNTDEVEVNWLLGTWSTPLIVVIAVSIVIGAGLGFLAARRRSR
jgi:uncharacterized integral membrane protein